VPGLGTRYRATGEVREITAGVQAKFESRRREALPAAWALTGSAAQSVARLQAHGIEVREIEAGTEAELDRFVIDRASRSPRPFQGHRLVRLRGRFERAVETLDQGTPVVVARQPLMRLAAQLLDPRSEDGFHTWGAFDADLGVQEVHPVLRLPELPGSLSAALPPVALAAPVIAPEASKNDLDRGLPLEVRVIAPGRALPTTDFESEPRWVGRAIRIAPSSAKRRGGSALGDAAAYLRGLWEGNAIGGQARPGPLVLVPGKGVLPSELAAVAMAARRVGWKVVRADSSGR